MVTNVLELTTMPDIEEYRTLEEAVDDKRVPYSRYWVRKLCQEGKIEAKKFGTGKRATWLVHMPSLLRYIEEMNRLGTQKHAQ